MRHAFDCQSIEPLLELRRPVARAHSAEIRKERPRRARPERITSNSSPKRISVGFMPIPLRAFNFARE